MKNIARSIALFASIAFLAGCAVVDVTKTAQGFYPPTDPNRVLILKTVPPQKYVELGTVTVMNFPAAETAKMHNAIRAKAAPLGADAVVLMQEGINENNRRWATGVALKYQ